jgi:hypothetical protein
MPALDKNLRQAFDNLLRSCIHVQGASKILVSLLVIFQVELNKGEDGICMGIEPVKRKGLQKQLLGPGKFPFYKQLLRFFVQLQAVADLLI